MKIRLAAITAALALAVGAAPAIAGTATATATVSGTVSTTCNIAATSPVSMTIDAINRADIAFSGTVTPTCTSGGTYQIALSSLNDSSATDGTGLMKGGSWNINYNLYQDAGHTVAWGSNAGTNTYAGTGTGTTQNITFYGLVTAANQSGAPVGTYTDTVNVTISY